MLYVVVASESPNFFCLVSRQIIQSFINKTSHILCKLLIIEIRNGKYCFTVKKKKKKKKKKNREEDRLIAHCILDTY